MVLIFAQLIKYIAFDFHNLFLNPKKRRFHLSYASLLFNFSVHLTVELSYLFSHWLGGD